MKNKLGNLIITCFIMCYSSTLFGQSSHKADTIYYLIDTAKIPVNDRLFLIGQEGEYYGYRLTCSCSPNHTDAVFSRIAKREGTFISRDQLKKIRLSSLRKLLEVVSLQAINISKYYTFYFLTPVQEGFIMHDVHLKFLPSKTHNY